MAAAYLDVVASLVIAGSAAVLDDAVAAVEVDDTVAAVEVDDTVAAVEVDNAVAGVKVDNGVAVAAVAAVDDAVADADGAVVDAQFDDAVAADDAVADAQIDDAVAAYHNGDDVADDLEIADECDHSHYRHKNSNLRVKVIHHPWQREVSSYLRKTVHWKVICLQN